jgi:hypothetical protein
LDSAKPIRLVIDKISPLKNKFEKK